MSGGSSGASAEFQPIELPHDKAGIETRMAEGFIRAATFQALLPFRVQTIVPNAENDFDFNLETSHGPKVLELVEIAPLQQLGGSYDSATGVIKSYPFAEQVLRVILGKSGHYGSRPPVGLHLLLYITHWAFLPGDAITSLLQYWCLRQQHGFEGIYWYAPFDDTTGVAFLLFPTPEEHWRGFDPESKRESTLHNLNPRGWTPSA